MKKIFKKSNILSFILGAIIFGGVGTVVAATILAKDVSYTPKDTSWQVDNVKDAIEDLYSKAKPEYTGSTTVTPTTSSQTLFTKNKILTNNITIEPIPSTYKKLTTTTTVSANTLLNGYKAYTSDGTLVTGSLSTNCVSGEFVLTQDNVSNGLKITDFYPSYFAISSINAGKRRVWYYNKNIDSSGFFSISVPEKTLSGPSTFSSQNAITIENNKLNLRLSTVFIGSSVEYMACK